MKITNRILTAAALTVLPASTLQAQDGARASATALYQSYTFAEPANAGIETLTLISTPFSVRVPLGRMFALSAGGAMAKGTMKRADGSESSISGLTDTGITAEARLLDSKLILSGILVLPTGYSTQTDEEAQVAGAIAADLLPFQVTNWGSGGGAGLHAMWVQPIDGGSLSIGGGFTAAREFEPRAEQEFTYQPGSEMRVQLAADKAVGRNGKAALQLGFSQYGDDASGGVNLYQSGSRIHALGSYAFGVGYRASGVVYGGLQHRSEGTVLVAPETVAAQDLIFGGAGVRLPLGSTILVPSTDIRLLRSADGVGQGYVASLGSSLEMGSGSVAIIPSARVRFGNIILLDDVESGITGLEAGLTVRFGGSR